MPLATVSFSHIVGLGGILRGVAPGHRAGRVCGCDVGGEFSVQHGIADAALQAASPDRRVVIGAPLIVGLEPGSDLAEAVEIGAAADVAAEVGEEEAVRLFLFGDGVVLLPELEDAVVEDAPVCRSVGRRQLAADRAVALRQAADRRPSIGVEAVHVVERVDLAHDGRNVVVHVAGEHAGLEEARIFAR